MANATEVKAGQVWLDWDKRFRGSGHERRIHIESVDEKYAYCLSDGVKKVRIRLDRFRPNSTGYKLLREEPSDAD
jgi:hypothetical protein